MTTAYSNSQLQTFKLTGRYDLPLEQRISFQIIVSEKGCWLWRGGTTSDKGGYGRIRVNGEKTLAHRAAFELFVRPIPVNLTLDHLCRVRLCVNPSHLIPKSQHQNVLAGESRMAQSATAATCKRGHDLSFEYYSLKGRRLIRRFCSTCRIAYRQRRIA